MNRPSLARLFFTFLRLGTTAFGGPAMIPFMRREAVDRFGWLSEKTFGFGMAVTQMVPGATAMQMAAYVGMRSRGALGAVAAYAGFSLPAFLLMLGLSFLYFTTGNVAWITSMFGGMQAVVVALILHASVNFSRRYLTGIMERMLALGTALWLFYGHNPIIALVAVCVVAVFVFRGQADAGAALSQEEAPCNHVGAAVILAVLTGTGLGLLFWFAPQLGDIAALMLKIDLFAFGGGYVSVPLMLHEVVEARGWMDASMFMDGIALGQITPGPIVMTATFVGYAVRGLVGAFVATVAVFTPSLFILLASTPLYGRLASSGVARRALRGSLVSLVGLMAAVAGRFLLETHWNSVSVFIAAAAFMALRLRLNVLLVVAAGAVLAALLS
ncbi:chromate efflux transporter [Pseudodesulfovibrio senegalensis]|uniref:Chromate efflux transporter n=1 Tax=Pseudodesulfovibrio senegalensis TaxID=1721087 RepID=A0A6N6N1R8_9BACT|nr:chromate efflux transporter [Pseudodesulfovibrio senegalensis]KAB1441756.1 chromate efflux transporter [Pseudodesulfovibrio senegalensis]